MGESAYFESALPLDKVFTLNEECRKEWCYDLRDKAILKQHRLLFILLGPTVFLFYLVLILCRVYIT